MNVLEKYNAALDLRANEERAKAAAAKAAGDERQHSIHLMCSSMLGDMLKALGRVEHEGKRPGILATQIESFQNESKKQQAQNDYDSADRSRIKAQTIAWAQDILRKLENENE